jgi:hypothetical protein
VVCLGFRKESKECKEGEETFPEGALIEGHSQRLSQKILVDLENQSGKGIIEEKGK